MGRLLRKKDPSKTKKKKKQAEGPSTAAEEKNNSAVKNTAAVFEPVKDLQKKPAPSQKAPLSPAKPVRVKQEKNFFEKSLQFLREVKVELKKVTWPSRKQTMGSTAVVIILVMIISLFLGIVDIGLSSLFRIVLQ
jgi:preprotein translocase subunit SecE